MIGICISLISCINPKHDISGVILDNMQIPTINMKGTFFYLAFLKSLNSVLIAPKTILTRTTYCEYYLQHISLFSQLQCSGSFKQDGHMILPHPTHVLLSLLQPQCSHSFIYTTILPLRYNYFKTEFQNMISIGFDIRNKRICTS